MYADRDEVGVAYGVADNALYYIVVEADPKFDGSVSQWECFFTRSKEQDRLVNDLMQVSDVDGA
jgi:hypothetical protein